MFCVAGGGTWRHAWPSASADFCWVSVNVVLLPATFLLLSPLPHANNVVATRGAKRETTRGRPAIGRSLWGRRYRPIGRFAVRSLGEGRWAVHDAVTFSTGRSGHRGEAGWRWRSRHSVPRLLLGLRRSQTAGRRRQ